MVAFSARRVHVSTHAAPIASGVAGASGGEIVKGTTPGKYWPRKGL